MTLISYSRPQPCDESRLQAFRAQRPCPARDKPWVLATAILGSSIAFIEGSVANLAMPAIQADLGINAAELQWVVNVYLLVLGAFTLVGGSLGDRFGLRRIFILGNAVFASGALGCAAAPSLSVLIAARIVQGLGAALLVPTSLALIGTYFNEEERGRAIGTWAGASALTTAIGPVLGGWLVDQWSWPAVFLLVVPMAALTIAIARWRVPPSRTENVGALDYLGALLLVGSLALLIFAVADSGSAPRRSALLFFAAISGAAFLWRELHFDTPILPLRLFRSRSFSGANAMTLLLYAALSGALYFLPFNLIQVQGYSATRAGAAFLPMTLLLGVGSTLAGDSIRKLDPRLMLTLGPLVAAAGFFALAAPGEDASYLGGFLPGIVILGIGMTLSVAPLTTVVMSSVSDRQTGAASGINNTVARLAGVLAVGALTAVAIASFSGGLEMRLREAGVPEALVVSLAAEAAQLAELEPPANVDPSLRSAIRGSVTAAYITTFRWVVAICGMLAVLSGLIAWFSLGRRSERMP